MQTPKQAKTVKLKVKPSALHKVRADPAPAADCSPTSLFPSPPPPLFPSPPPPLLPSPPPLLHKPMANRGGLIPDSGTVYELFDRVVSVALHTAVPFALRGTVIGIHGGKAVCACVCACVRVCVRVCVRACVRVYKHVSVLVVPACVCLCVHARVYVCACVHVFVCEYCQPVVVLLSFTTLLNVRHLKLLCFDIS